MKMRWLLPKKLLPFYLAELNSYQQCLSQKNFAKAWRHLERAHIMGQAFPVPHTQVHWHMLLFGLRTRNFSEISGQAVRLVLGFIGSLIGKYPVGNTGGANVPMLQNMPIPDDIAQLLKENN